MSESRDNSSKIYTLRILRTFKGETAIDRIAKIQGRGGKRSKKVVNVATERETAACGVRLDISKVYLLLGYVETHTDTQRLRTDNCKWHPLWRDITAQQRRGLKAVNVYKTNCQCKIEKYCFKRPRSLCDDMIGGCDAEVTNSRLTYCRAKHSFCAKVSDTECKWILSKKAAFKKCIES